MGYLTRTVDDVIDWSRRQITNPTQDWGNLCQSHCRQSYGVAAWAGSAWEAWTKIPTAQRFDGGKPNDAPRGALLYYRGGSYGHVAIAIGKSTNDKCLSNDYKRRGKIDEAPRSFAGWGITYVGWSFWTPYGTLRADTPVGLWDGNVPDIDGVYAAEADPTLANPAAWRLACRLDDLGHYAGTPKPKGQQGYPAKAVANWQASRGYNVQPPGRYGPNAHDLIFQ